MNHTPIVIESEGRGERSYDIYSRLLKDRIILINGEIDHNTSAAVVAQLLHLSGEDSDSDIQMYINSPGGVITSGLAIYDTMTYIPCDIQTICVGQAASMGAFLLAGGTKGKRIALPNAEVMIHQPSGGARGTAEDIIRSADHIVNLRKKLNKMLADFTSNSIKKISKDVDRDYWMDANKALEYGIVDKILTNEGDK